GGRRLRFLPGLLLVCGLRNRLEAPELEALVGDGLLDRPALEGVGHGAVGRDRADRRPRLELRRQARADEIVREGAQRVIGFGFEDKQSHVGPLVCPAVGPRVNAVTARRRARRGRGYTCSTVTQSC